MAQIIENENVVIIDNGEEVSYRLYTVIHHYKMQGGWDTRRVKLIGSRQLILLFISDIHVTFRKTCVYRNGIIVLVLPGTKGKINVGGWLF